MISLLAALVLTQTDPFGEIRAAIASGDKSRALALFPHPEDARYMREMLGRKGLEAMQVSVAPCPPGWTDFGPYVVCFHRFNQLEDDHDPLYGTIPMSDGSYRLGKELPEDGCPQKATYLKAFVKLFPDQHRMTAKAAISIDPGRRSRAALVRLGDDFQVDAVANYHLLNADAGPVQPREGDIVRVGSFLIPWSTKCPRKLDISYEGTLRLKAEGKVAKGIVDIDQVEPTYAILNSYWSPQIARTAMTADISVAAPKDWFVESEGVHVTPNETPLEGQTVTAFHNDVPISNPKIVAGLYKVSAQLVQNGVTFRCLELEPLDHAAAEKAVQDVAAAEAVYSTKLAPFPYKTYDVIQAPRDHYGIESYSYTLEPRSGYHFATHEMSHTYFGGVGVCTYIHDSWNEGLGTYLDDIVFKKNFAALNGGLRSIRYPKPLNQMYFEWGDGSSSYSRGAYVMKMLEAEITQDKVLAGLAAMLKDRLGKDTRWDDIRQYEERASGKRLDWFWAQWVDNGVFPTLEIANASTTKTAEGFRTTVTLRQSGTPKPFRMRFNIRAAEKSEPILLDEGQKTVTIDTTAAPKTVSLDVLGLTLCKVGPPFPIGPSVP